ncbi:sigma-70 family RNA polymerase sigma factor (plasmid) [Nocardia sp. NBC_01503]|uniref:RNA polymerase sigma factor n=1 Tax=Nocardia sp. NBC_01503 TaxID=2975997 RepID=UPI002E7AF532|nr:sigma-70 family RNA polymerase sigma factor [Nocardia sp. NBC_01503]WTL36677.1 sigma-70 family RNA polymerase sigma factor [Nocardia sp. NBC_01503]WTL36770.1 sigma-70 family RNA polymerase sigma factor [Nocardia sp. NBC_01503]
MSDWDSELLFRQYAVRVFRLAFKAFRGDAESANDVVQDVFLAVCRQLKRDFHHRSAEQVEKLIMTIAKRRVVDHLRKIGRSREYSAGMAEDLDRQMNHAGHAGDGGTENLSDEVMASFWHALTRELTPTEHRVATMTWLLEMTPDEIAKALKTSRRAVYTHRSRARGKMEQALNRGGNRTEADAEPATSGMEVATHSGGGATE